MKTNTLTQLPTPALASRAMPLGLLLMDLAERGVLLALYAWMNWRFLTDYAAGGNAANLLMLVSEALVVFFVLIRRSTPQVSRRVGEWLLAFGATTAPMLIQPASGAALVPPPLAATMLLMGMIVELHSKLVLGRSFGCVPANRGLKLSGPYRYVRHPMYAGYLLCHLAFLSMNLSVWNISVLLVCLALQIPRLFAEERLLCLDLRYAKYAQQVRYRLFPGIF